MLHPDLRWVASCFWLALESVSILRSGSQTKNQFLLSTSEPASEQYIEACCVFQTDVVTRNEFFFSDLQPNRIPKEDTFAGTRVCGRSHHWGNVCFHTKQVFGFPSAFRIARNTKRFGGGRKLMISDPFDARLREKLRGRFHKQANKLQGIIDPSSALLSPFLGEGSPSEVDYREKLVPLF